MSKPNFEEYLIVDGKRVHPLHANAATELVYALGEQIAAETGMEVNSGTSKIWISVKTIKSILARVFPIEEDGSATTQLRENAAAAVAESQAFIRQMLDLQAHEEG